MNWIDVEQNTDDWLQHKAGRIGGSSIGTIMANYGKAFGNPAHNLAAKIALEQTRGTYIESNYTNGHMQRGHEQEPIARMLYEDQTFCAVTNGGLFTEGEDIGVSPDGLVGDDGVIEIKSVIAPVQVDTIKRNTFDSAYKWQLAFELKVTGRDWLDYISFCADFPDGKKLFIVRVYPSLLKEEFKQIDVRLNEFRRLVSEKKAIIKNAPSFN